MLQDETSIGGAAQTRESLWAAFEALRLRCGPQPCAEDLRALASLALRLLDGEPPITL